MANEDKYQSASRFHNPHYDIYCGFSLVLHYDADARHAF